MTDLVVNDGYADNISADNISFTVGGRRLGHTHGRTGRRPARHGTARPWVF